MKGARVTFLPDNLGVCYMGGAEYFHQIRRMGPKRPQRQKETALLLYGDNCL